MVVASQHFTNRWGIAGAETRIKKEAGKSTRGRKIEGKKRETTSDRYSINFKIEKNATGQKELSKRWEGFRE